MTTPVEDTTKETVSMPSRSRAKAKAKEKARETVIIAERLGTTRESVPIRKRAKAKAKVSNENVTTVGKKATPQESARRAKMEERPKEKETVTK